MKRLMTFGAATLALLAASPAFAQHVAPSGTTFAATGPASLNGLPCTLTLNADTNSTGTGGTVLGGSNTGPSICPFITIDSGATYTVDSYDPTGNGSASATLSGLVVRVGGSVACVQSAPLAFSITNDGAGGSTIDLTGAVGGCSVSASIATPTVQATS